jgi:hypothetical protein
VRRARKPAVVLALALACAGCGQQQSRDRTQVATYVRRVSAIEAKLTTPVAAVTRVGAAFAAAGRKPAPLTGAVPSGQEATLAQAQAQIEAQGRALRALSTPPAARRLRSLLLSFTGNEIAMTHELALMVAFMPRFDSELTPLAPAATRLAHVLAQRQAAGAAAVAALFAAKAGALRRFEATTAHMTARLGRLAPPAVLRPQYQAQLASLRGMGTSAGRLAAALAGGAPANVTPLLLAFDRAAAATHSSGALRAQTAAVRAYSSRVARLATLAQAIASERLRLADTLG